MIKNSKILNFKYIRYLGAIFAFIIVAPVFFLAGFDSKITRIISLSLFTIVAIYTIWEFVKNMEISLLSKILLPFIAIPIMILDIDLITINKILPSSHSAWIKNNLHLTITNSLTFYSFLLVFIIGLIVLIDPIARKIFDPTRTILYLIIGIAFPTFAIKSAFVLTAINPIFLLVIIPTAIISDTFAYFGGRLLSKRFPKKFAPNISPKKTWIGFWVGYIFTVIYLSLLFAFADKIIFKKIQINEIYRISMIVILVIILPIVSPIGDLIYSKFKRERNIKDFSNLIPGHGGILDRIDSWVLLFITFIFIFQFLG
ncbi:MAG: phosphatidate cytidylyltransferase [Mycoplasma sp.]|nr:phosphatidate cytidylyltransferase [Mycoplasma sp.]